MGTARPTATKLPPLVVVTWHDAYLRSSAVTKEDAVKDAEYALRLTVGWLVEDNDRVVRLAMTYDPPDPGDDPEYDDRYTILKQYVESVRYVTRKPRPKKEVRDVREAAQAGE